ncbi:MAG: cyclase family protein [Acidobacteria bacterium]|nr:cyclase family protein [Acidobacteriota bacterium]MCW5969573.1 cyclase family protein [Blastocatellales bacterium]
MKIYDVTVALANDSPVYPGDPNIEIRRTSTLEAGDVANVSHLSCSSHVGTHVDPPSHFIAGARPLDELPLDVLIGPARVVDVGEVDSIDSAVLHGCDLSGATRVLFKTRNSRLWSGPHEFDRSFVHLEADAAGDLVAAGVRLVGIDYLSIEKFNFDEPRTHLALLSNDVIIVEGLDLRAVEPGDYELICLPLKIRDGDGGPARVVLRELS